MSDINLEQQLADGCLALAGQLLKDAACIRSKLEDPKWLYNADNVSMLIESFQETLRDYRIMRGKLALFLYHKDKREGGELQ